MNLDPSASYIELRVPFASSERQFLLFAVQAAVKQYRELHAPADSLPSASHRAPVIPQADRSQA